VNDPTLRAGKAPVAKVLLADLATIGNLPFALAHGNDLIVSDLKAPSVEAKEEILGRIVSVNRFRRLHGVTRANPFSSAPGLSLLTLTDHGKTP
jgi:hypothetical protein